MGGAARRRRAAHASPYRTPPTRRTSHAPRPLRYGALPSHPHTLVQVQGTCASAARQVNTCTICEREREREREMAMEDA